MFFLGLLIVVAFATDAHLPLKEDATIEEVVKHFNLRFAAREYVCNWFPGPNTKACWIVGQKLDRKCNVQGGVVNGNTFAAYKPFLGGSDPHFTFYRDTSCTDEVFDQDLRGTLHDTAVQTNGCYAHTVESHCVNHC